MRFPNLISAIRAGYHVYDRTPEVKLERIKEEHIERCIAALGGYAVDNEHLQQTIKFYIRSAVQATDLARYERRTRHHAHTDLWTNIRLPMAVYYTAYKRRHRIHSRYRLTSSVVNPGCSGRVVTQTTMIQEDEMNIRIGARDVERCKQGLYGWHCADYYGQRGVCCMCGGKKK